MHKSCGWTHELECADIVSNIFVGNGAVRDIRQYFELSGNIRNPGNEIRQFSINFVSFDIIR